MNLVIRAYVFLAALLLSSSVLAALPAEELGKKIDAVLSRTAPHPFSGGVLITQGAQAVYARTLGQQRDTAARNPEPDSQFLIGSISQQMTAALVLREADAKHLDLNLPIKRYLPELRDSWAYEVTTAQLLNHTSGIVELGKPLNSAPGTTFAYSNLDYFLLGMLVERVSGTPFTTLAESMFKTCKMVDTMMPPSETIANLQRRLPRLVTGYNEQADGTFRIEQGKRLAEHNAENGAISTLADLALWDHCLHGGSVLSYSAYQAMTTPSVNAQRRQSWGTLGYGYGIQVLNADGIQEMSHNGYVGGYMATLLYYPKEKVSVVIFENTAWLQADMGRAFALHDQVRAVVRSYLGSEKKPFWQFNWRRWVPFLRTSN